MRVSYRNVGVLVGWGSNALPSFSSCCYHSGPSAPLELVKVTKACGLRAAPKSKWMLLLSQFAECATWCVVRPGLAWLTKCEAVQDSTRLKWNLCQLTSAVFERMNRKIWHFYQRTYLHTIYRWVWWMQLSPVKNPCSGSLAVRGIVWHFWKYPYSLSCWDLDE